LFRVPVFVIIKKEKIVGIRIVLYNSSKVLMITKYRRIIGYINICWSVQDHIIYQSKYWACFRASEAQEAQKTMIEDLKKVNQKSTHWIKRNDASQKLKRSSDFMEIIKLRRPNQTQKTPSGLENLQNSEAPEGPRLHVRFVVFYGCLHQRIWAQSCLLLTTCRNRQNFKENKNEWVVPDLAKDFRMTIQRNYSYQTMSQRPWFEASQRLLIRWYSSPTSLKSLPI